MTDLDNMYEKLIGLMVNQHKYISNFQFKIVRLSHYTYEIYSCIEIDGREKLSFEESFDKWDIYDVLARYDEEVK